MSKAEEAMVAQYKDQPIAKHPKQQVDLMIKPLIGLGLIVTIILSTLGEIVFWLKNAYWRSYGFDDLFPSITFFVYPNTDWHGVNSLFPLVFLA